MSAMIGRSLAQYHVTGFLGAGGMGEVFRARDTKLGRDVAVKVLPAALAGDAERVARFRREAQLLAALHHPNVASVFGLEESDGTVALVMELVEGEDLAQRITRGAIPTDEAIAIAQQIAEGLEAAHEKGIVHRDLKPANVKLTADGAVKILDFGLAKALEGDDAAASGPSLTQSPTMSRQMTEAGMILGTAAYMSPEQARGRPVDKRSDIWSFGVVLYEVLAGHRLFGGETVSDTLAAVLRQDLDLGALPAATPPHVRHLLARCLERDPKRRLRDVGEARLALAEGGVPGVAAAPARPARRREIAAWIAAALALAAAGALALRGGAPSDTRRSAIRLNLEPPRDVAFDSGQDDWIVVSPDGRRVVFTGRTPDGHRQLMLRELDAFDARPLPDTEDPIEPFWSPDGKSIAFGGQGKLKRLELAGGRPRAIADAPRMVGGDWSTDGTIVFVPDFNSGLRRVSSEGGEVRVLREPDPSRREVALRAPAVLPDGRHYLYTGGERRTDTFVGSLDGKEAVRLLSADTSDARYVPPGWLLFTRDAALFARRFDAKRLEFAGEPIRIVTGPAREADGPDITGGIRAHFSVSGNGVLVWQRFFMPEYQLFWYDRSGARLGPVGSPIHMALTMAPRLSRDGTRLALQNRDPMSQRLGIWVLELARGVSTRLTDVLGQFPIWSPDGSRVAWLEARDGVAGIRQRAPNGATEAELLLKSSPEAGGTTFPSDWSADGRYVIYTARGAKTRADIWALPLFGDRRPYPLLKTESDEQSGQLSSDGRWLAYRSDASGTYEIYLQSVTAEGRMGAERFRISENGGAQPRIRRDGRELYYLAPDARLMAVELTVRGASLEPGTPKPLFRTSTLPRGAGASFEYDVTADGQRFVVGTVLDGSAPPTPVVVLDWLAELNGRPR